MISTVCEYSLKTCDYVPFVSTASNLLHLFARYAVKPTNQTAYGRYLNQKSLTDVCLDLIPFARLICSVAQKILNFFSKKNSYAQKRSTAQEPINFNLSALDADLVAAHLGLFSRPRAAGAHSGDIFSDSEIIEHPSPLNFEGPYPHEDPMLQISTFEFKKNGQTLNKSVILQEAQEGCTAGVSFMLAYDHGKLLNYTTLKHRTASGYTQIIQDLESLGLTCRQTSLQDLIDPNSHELSIKLLKRAIDANGPAYVRIRAQGASIAHAVIVDDIDMIENIVRLRDPWHGWFFGVQLNSFLDQWKRPWQILNPPHTLFLQQDFIVQVVN